MDAARSALSLLIIEVVPRPGDDYTHVLCEYLGAKGTQGCKGMSGTSRFIHFSPICASHTLAPLGALSAQILTISGGCVLELLLHNLIVGGLGCEAPATVVQGNLAHKKQPLPLGSP